MISSDKYIFRKAEKEDASAVFALYKSVIGEEFCVWNEYYPDMLEIEADLASDNLNVLTDGEKIIGAISIVPDNELDGFNCFTSSGAEIARVVIVKEYRARGLSYKMVGEIEKILCGRGIKAIHLSVAKSNIPAYKTYIKAGFKTVGETEMFGSEYFLMEKEITPYIYIRIRENPTITQQAAEWFSGKWKVPTDAYLKCINNYLSGETEYGWYLCLQGEKIIGGLGVIENDFHNRPDLTPNVCAVYVEPEYRSQGIAGHLLNMVVCDLRSKSITPVYLITDHIGFYERYGWEFLCMVQGDGESKLSRMYIHR